MPSKFDTNQWIRSWSDKKEMAPLPPAIKLQNGDKLLNIAQFLPIIGTGIDAYNLYKDPSWENAGYLALSLIGDLAMPFKAVKGVAKAAKLQKLAAANQKAKGMGLILKKGMNPKKVKSGFDKLNYANQQRRIADENLRKALGVYVASNVPDVASDIYQINQAE